MQMKYLLGIATLVFGSTCSMDLIDHGSTWSSSNADLLVIPGASYYVYEGADECIGAVPAHSKSVHFYTADGESLTTIRHKFRFGTVHRMLDVHAPKPRPVTYKVKYWHAFPRSYAMGADPGYFLIFYDKNGNVIKSYRVSVGLTQRVQRELDLSHFDALEFDSEKIPCDEIEGE